MNKKLVIAIDGPSASGKGTLAKKIAQHFDLAYLNTGIYLHFTQQSGNAYKSGRILINRTVTSTLRTPSKS